MVPAVATGYFEIGSLLQLDGDWQKLEKIRILMGAEMTQRTRKALLEAVLAATQDHLDRSLEVTKDKNPFLDDVPRIRHCYAHQLPTPLEGEPVRGECGYPARE